MKGTGQKPASRRTGAQPDDDPCFALYEASRALAGYYRPYLAELGLTYPQYLVMLIVWRHGPVSVKELGAALSLDSGTLSPLLKRLIEAGLVDKQRADRDARTVDVTSTEKGMTLRDRADAIAHEARDSLHYTAAERAALVRSLEDLAERLRRVDQPQNGV
ncbi:MarR family winged helix-turn-helix transcriptional regulator [Streptomyces zaomyceticus]|uniref:MarR family winged helix-turn-helix transcriptional regulator n=1 Tax=Streptomyces zaomyceticus TaxID=68286 RepID=UPI003697F595